MTADLDALLSDFDSFRAGTKPGAKCKICSSPHRALIEELFRRGASRRSIALFLFQKFDYAISDNSVVNHCTRHLSDAGPEEPKR